jgi:hypothetical protein
MILPTVEPPHQEWSSLSITLSNLEGWTEAISVSCNHLWYGTYSSGASTPCLFLLLVSSINILCSLQFCTILWTPLTLNKSSRRLHTAPLMQVTQIVQLRRILLYLKCNTQEEEIGKKVTAILTNQKSQTQLRITLYQLWGSAKVDFGSNLPHVYPDLVRRESELQYCSAQFFCTLC